MRTKKVNKHFHSRMLFKYLLSWNNKQKKELICSLFFFNSCLFVKLTKKNFKKRLCFLTFKKKKKLLSAHQKGKAFCFCLFLSSPWVNLSTRETKECSFSFCLWEHYTLSNEKNKHSKKKQKRTFLRQAFAFMLCFVWEVI